MDYQIYNEDCINGMSKLADGSVDMILTDLPYGITDCNFDVRIPFEPMWEQFKRVTKRNAAIVLFSQMPFGAELIMSNRKMFRYEWIWEKSLGVGFLNVKKMPLRCHENILVFYQQLPTYNPQHWFDKPYQKPLWQGKTTRNYNIDDRSLPYENPTGKRFPIDILQFYSCNRHFGSYSLHPQQKPIDLLEYLIKTYTNDGETVLDATMGSGSTGVAAVNLGRKFIGFELQPKFYDIAKKRIDEALVKKSQELF